MNVNFIKGALSFHGPPLQMIWDDEQGSGQLQKLGVGQQVDYSIYHERQKSFTFQDRAKRLKLHQFFARKALNLYDRELNIATGVLDEEHLQKAKPLFATTPPYECFVNPNQDRIKRWRAVLEGIEPGNIIYGIITKVSFQSTNSPFMIKPLCTEEPLVRYLNDIPIKAYINFNNLGTLPLDAQGTPRRYAVNDYVCCVVLEISIDADRLYLSMEKGVVKNKKIKLGLITYENMPKYYKKAVAYSTENYNQCLRESKEFLNPNYDILFSINGLNIRDHFSMMNSLKYPFPREDYAKALRQAQASQWAVRSVVEGITLFRDGHHMEAFQSLNKALNIDPRNVEGLVARGALYANKSSFLKAIEDFEAALKLAPNHANARSYIAETLVALGRNYEEKQKFPDAINAYKDCLKWMPNHEQALSSLISIQTHKNCQPYLHLLPELAAVAPVVPLAAAAPIMTRDIQMPSTSKAAAELPQNSNNFNVYDGSMSPLSKRMALHAATLKAAEKTKAPYNQPFYMSSNFGMDPNHNQINMNMQTQLNNVILDDDDDDDTLSQVRKLLQKASKHKSKDKEREKDKEKYKSSSSSKKKKHRKSKSNSPSMEKDKRKNAKDNMDSKKLDKTTLELNRELEKYEKNIAKIVKRQDDLKASISKNSMSSLSPPPPPSMRLPIGEHMAKINQDGLERGAQKLSFQIRRPVKVDKFGLVRIATPLTQRSPTVTPERSARSRSRERTRRRRYSRERSKSRYSRERSRSRRNSRSRSRRRRYSRSRSRRRRYTRSRSPSRGHSRGNGYRTRRRSPSPFVPRETPSPRRRAHSRNDRSVSANGIRGKFGNLVWQRENYKGSNANVSSNANGNNMDDPSIEEIDEMITKAQKERKQEIINRDKNILKKGKNTS